MTAMSMPETTVDKDRFLAANEHDIRFAWQVFAMEPISIAHSMETTSDEHFRLRIFALNSLHDTPSLVGCSRVHKQRLSARMTRADPRVDAAWLFILTCASEVEHIGVRQKQLIMKRPVE